jgi:hypothetical protein
MPAPRRDLSEPTPIPLPEEPASTISSTTRSAGSPTISTVPYSNGPAPIASRRHRLTGLAPSQRSTAIDTRSPSWPKEPPTADDNLSDIELEENDSPKNASGALTLWQMLTIVSSAGLLIGSALAVRAFQNQQRRTANADFTPPPQQQPKLVPAMAAVHSEAKAIIPPPHLSPKSFVATPVPRINASAGTMSEMTQRQRAFADLLNHELPIIEEPLALRPGIPLGPPAAAQPIWRHDAGTATVEPPVSRPVSAPQTANADVRQHLDAPHSRFSSGPHLRIGPEAPVERALRQLQGGRS